eukprot:CAMPEP_0117585730 /NCGR_PEP_ID=MMETSP0784-20121206/68316_1 /TAXON_ID=39447 /ORGANISM="" /LENGTH=62 /DNA_ID=CAMNT_0005386727 /DNA_START=389 /DNA_END=577 /DNA_ORIENTATION=-
MSAPGTKTHFKAEASPLLARRGERLRSDAAKLFAEGAWHRRPKCALGVAPRRAATSGFLGTS